MPRQLKWNEPAQEAFNKLRKAFTTAPILQHPNPDIPFTVEVDASDMGVGLILSQCTDEKNKMYSVVLFSHKLFPSEQNYNVGNRELPCHKTRPGRMVSLARVSQTPVPCTVDHKNLEYLKAAKILNPREAR